MSNTWLAANAELSEVGGGKVRQYYAKSCLGGASHTFTLTLSASNYATLSITEVSGLDLSAPLDQTSPVVFPPSGTATSHTSNPDHDDGGR